MQRVLTPEQVDHVCRLYESGRGSSSLAAEFGVCSRTIRNWLEKSGVQRRAPEQYHRKHTVDHHFFQDIDTEAKAYWMGFIAADGCVKENGTLSVLLSQKDKGHLETLNRTLSSSYPIGNYDYGYESLCHGQRVTTGPSCSLQIRSHQLTQDLTRHGITPRKTWSLRWPLLALALERHFLRGYVDGDGCFSRFIPHCGSPSIAFSLIGNEPFLIDCQRLLVSRCGLPTNKLVYARPGVNESRVLSYHHRERVERIAQFLYDNSTLSLARKREVVFPTKR